MRFRFVTLKKGIFTALPPKTGIYTLLPLKWLKRAFFDVIGAFRAICSPIRTRATPRPTKSRKCPLSALRPLWVEFFARGAFRACNALFGRSVGIL